MAPLPQGVKKAECHYKNRSFMNEVVMNSTGKEWTDLQIQWNVLEVIIFSFLFSASVIKEYGVYWDEIGVTLNFWCPKTGCRPEICPHGFVTTKFGCITCECAGQYSCFSNRVPFGVCFCSAMSYVRTAIIHSIQHFPSRSSR
ncbi:unnamed protein product [Porites evermanni]|uniref:Antistasin-like domain-containing protein n=1 Tax=Porites evermanni TaxID=104178 RepID=A0ABN8M2L9_9CNID|nr:unnamed protein product [Porites evermanni]